MWHIFGGFDCRPEEWTTNLLTHTSLYLFPQTQKVPYKWSVCTDVQTPMMSSKPPTSSSGNTLSSFSQVWYTTPLTPQPHGTANSWEYYYTFVLPSQDSNGHLLCYVYKKIKSTYKPVRSTNSNVQHLFLKRITKYVILEPRVDYVKNQHLQKFLTAAICFHLNTTAVTVNFITFLR